MYTRILISFYLPIVTSYIPVPAGRTVIQDAVWQKCQAKELCCSEAKKLAQQCLDFLQRMAEECRDAQKVQNQQPTEARAGECIHWGLELGDRNLGCCVHAIMKASLAAKNCFRKSSFSCGVKMRYVVECLTVASWQDYVMDALTQTSAAVSTVAVGGSDCSASTRLMYIPAA